MFWDVYTRLCAKAGKAPNVIAREVCGVKSTGTVTGWKNGATPRNNVLGPLSDYFGVSVDYLLTGEDPEQKEKPSTPEGDGLDSKLSAYYDGMTPEERAKLIEYAEFIVSKRKDGSNG